jgi:hypothetical protein
LTVLPDVESHVSPEYGPRGYDGKAFVEALCNLTYFPALESLVLHFRENDGPFKSDTRGNPNDREFPSEVILQFLVFKALSDQPPGFLPPLKSLTVDKYLPLPNPSITSESIKALLGNLDHLAIKTTTQCEAFPMTDPRVEVYGNPVFKKDFLPASLVSLELHHAYVRSAYMTIPLKHVHLPRLERLSLQRSQFSEKDELEAFIIRHGTTLVELKLFLCPMALSTSTSSKRPKRFRRWAQVWDRLSVELKLLRNLVVSERHDAMGVEDDGVPRYVDNCYYCNEVKLAEAEIVEDEKALERFRKKVEARLPQ